MSRDSIGKIVGVAAALCVVCSVVVSAIAVGLRDKQEANVKLEKKRNVLVAAGLVERDDKSADVAKLFERIESLVIDVDTGKPVEGRAATEIDSRAAIGKPEASVATDSEYDPRGTVRRRPKLIDVYLVKDAADPSRLESVVLPIHGSGLWSTMFGFLALAPDLKEVKGIVYYEQAETPGLGGEVDNPRWRAQFAGKQLFDEDGSYHFNVIKGQVPPGDPNAEHKADGITGATITCNGVDDMLRYWMSEGGYRPFFDWLRTREKTDG